MVAGLITHPLLAISRHYFTLFYPSVFLHLSNILILVSESTSRETQTSQQDHQWHPNDFGPNQLTSVHRHCLRLPQFLVMPNIGNHSLLEPSFLGIRLPACGDRQRLLCLPLARRGCPEFRAQPLPFPLDMPFFSVTWPTRIGSNHTYLLKIFKYLHLLLLSLLGSRLLRPAVYWAFLPGSCKVTSNSICPVLGGSYWMGSV